MRELTSEERRVIVTLAKEFKSEEQRDQLLDDLNNCAVTPKVADGSILRFEIIGYLRPQNHRSRLYVSSTGPEVEGVVNDADGAELDVLLFADSNCRVYELELVRYLPGSVIKPNWDTFRVKPA